MAVSYRLETDAGIPIAGHVELADTVLSRFLGLMFRRELRPEHGLAIRPCNSVHMFFMRFPIDVLFVDGDGVVVRVIESIPPWRASSFVRGAKAAIELPPGTAARCTVVRGTRVRLVEGPAAS